MNKKNNYIIHSLNMFNFVNKIKLKRGQIRPLKEKNAENLVLFEKHPGVDAVAKAYYPVQVGDTLKSDV